MLEDEGELGRAQLLEVSDGWRVAVELVILFQCQPAGLAPSREKSSDLLMQHLERFPVHLFALIQVDQVAEFLPLSACP